MTGSVIVSVAVNPGCKFKTAVGGGRAGREGAGGLPEGRGRGRGRGGSRRGAAGLGDAAVHDGLWSTFTRQHMGESSDAVNRDLDISREEQDAWAARSHARAHTGWEAGRLPGGGG